MCNRYNPNLFLLDLTRLYMDSVLLEKDILALLENPTVFKQTMQIIKENIPNIKALNLSHNKLKVSHIRELRYIVSEKSQLSALNLEYNDIADRQFLKYLKNFPLKELNVQHNRFVEQMKNPSSYIKLVKKEIPELEILDKVDIESYLSKKSGENSNATSSGPSGEIITADNNNYGVEINESSVKTFLQEYYILFDEADKSKLTQAYTPTAKFQVKCLGADLNGTFEGTEKISLALQNLPPFKHSLESFGLNIVTIERMFCNAVITGECIVNESLYMCFKRTMKIEQYNQGLCCSNDILELSLKSE